VIVIVFELVSIVQAVLEKSPPVVCEIWQVLLGAASVIPLVPDGN